MDVIHALIFRPCRQGPFFLKSIVFLALFMTAFVGFRLTLTLGLDSGTVNERLLTPTGLFVSPGDGQTYLAGVGKGLKLGLLIATSALIAVVCAGLFTLACFQRTLDAKQHVILGFAVAFLGTLSIAVLGTMLYKMMLIDVVTAKKVQQFMISSTLMIIPTVILGALRSARELCRT